MEQTTKKAGLGRLLRACIPVTLPVITGYFGPGITYGILMVEAGYGPLWIGLMSAIGFAGSMQFVAITLLVTAFDPLQAFLLAIMVNARHIFYGLSLLDKYKNLGILRFPTIYGLTDEVYSLVTTVAPPEDVEPRWYYFTISLISWLSWLCFTVLGGFIGNLITFDTTGMDFALTAMFVVLFLEQLKKKENRPAGAIGIVCSMLCLAVFGGDGMIIPSMLVILIVLIGGREKLCT